MTEIRCFVGQVRAPGTAVPLPLRLQGQQPGDYITAAGASTGTPLTVTMDYSRLHDVAAPTANAFHLHKALRELTSNAPLPGCTTRIGLVLADRYADDSAVLGYMFDTGFDPDANPGFNAMPREGCAIFLDAIRDLRPSTSDYETEAGFTAVHELGHVFNLWHVETSSFMKQSQTSGPFGTQAFRFVADHRQYLSHIGSRFVCPGGSLWEERGDLVVPPGGLPQNGPPARRIRLRIGLPQEEFWCFEPVQLDVSISTAPGVERTRIPDTVDPGYDGFNIWIDAPDGTRRPYRSPVLYCDRRPLRTIVRGLPFRRDIPLFGQSAGYTFRIAGLHRIFCTFRLRDGSIAASNAVEALVKPASRVARFARLRDALTDRDNAQTLFYRDAVRVSKVIEPLEFAARDLGRTPASANVRYSLAKALATTSHMRSRTTRVTYQKRAARLLKTALDSGVLSRSRQRRAAETLDGLDHG